MDIDGRVALITGGSSGLGEATAQRLVAAGAQVVVFDLRPPRRDTDGVHFVEGDVTDPTGVARAIEVAEGLGELAVLVNCAGVGSNERVARPSAEGATAGDLEAFRRVVDINLVGTFNTMRLASAAMATHAGDHDGARGVIINTASIAAYEGQVGQAAYSASKAAVVALSFVAARDLAPLGIRVNAIAPGLMETPLLSTVRDDIREGLIASTVFPRRIGLPAEYASLAAHLIDNDYLNGETIRLDAATRLPYRR
jgi:NAD(P)-dependent dehydrogenase (short-subunit alcohol dehydrogenase family)